MPNDPTIPATGQHIKETGPRDIGCFTGYEGVLQRADRDKSMEQKVRDGREKIKDEKDKPEKTIEGTKTTPPIGDEPH